VRPLGGVSETPFDARIIAATNRDLESMVDDGRFRADLYYRLAVITVGLPPLRARENDVLLLAQHFLNELASASGSSVTGISSAAATRLRAYAWPGNVRELKNAVERAVALTRFDHIVPEDLPDKIRQGEARTSSPELDALAPLEEIERRYILKVLEAVGGNKSLAAETLGLNRKTLYRKLASWGIAS
jgi:two-component system response regulator HydG